MTNRLTRLVGPMRRPVAVVLWGGRVGIDLQAGSPEDLRLARRRLLWARVMRRQAAHVAAVGAAMSKVGMSAAVAGARMAEALKRLGVTVAEVEESRRRDPRARRLEDELAYQERLAELHRLDRPRP